MWVVYFLFKGHVSGVVSFIVWSFEMIVWYLCLGEFEDGCMVVVDWFLWLWVVYL